MRKALWHLGALLFPLLAASPLALAQEPTPTPPPASEAPATTPPEASPRGQRGGARRGQQRRAAVAIQAAFVHPVSGPMIENGVVLLRGDRIVAVGKQGEVDIPEGTAIRTFPSGHVYPGLIDAETDAFTDPAQKNGPLDAGIALADDLQLRHNRDDQLAAAGITTAYISATSGQGSVVHVRQDGFEVWEGKEKAALQMRMTGGPVPTHALARQQQLEGMLKVFDGLDTYKKAKEDHQKALDKYVKEFEEYLAFHQKKKDSGQPATPAAGAPATPPVEGRPTPGEGRRTPGRRVPPGGGGDQPGAGQPGAGQPGPGQPGAGQKGEELEQALEQLLLALAAQDPPPAPPKQDPPTPPLGQNPRGGPAPGGTPAAVGQATEPKRPTYPKAPPEDPIKEALLRVLDGELPLRIEAHRADELRAALSLLRDKDVPLLVLEQAYGADAIADQIARSGATVVVTDVLPNSMPKLYESFDPQALPAKLQKAGVPFAIATGSARRASLLPTMAAAAVGKGLDREAALRAITLTPAEILGVQKDTGSLQNGKFADLVIFDRPLFESDSRVLLVLGRGRTEYEAK